MNMHMKKFFFIIFFLCSIAGYAQHQSSGLKISLLTCAPGEELYSTFGHTAIRVYDSVNRTDQVYNYGLFNFEEPNFYLKFTRGSLDYILGVQSYDEFLYEYQFFKRTVWEQDINLTAEQQENIVLFLANNQLPENRAYRYDFIYDNCATRARDVILRQFPGYVVEKPYMEAGTTARDLFHYYLDNGRKQAWSKLGIDVLLGSGIDTAMNKFTGMFLPEFLMNAFENTTYNGKPIVSARRVLVEGEKIRQSNYYAPFMAVALFSSALLVLYHFKRRQVFLINMLDSFLLFTTGLLGILILFMWFATEHESCKDNYNLLWALPANVVAAFIVSKKSRVLGIYFLAALTINLCLLAGWFFLPQEMNFALIPFVLLMSYRYFILYKKINGLHLNRNSIC